MVTLITSKGNGYNYYGYTDVKEPPVEVIKVGGRFYRAKLVIGQWLIRQGTPLTGFTLIE